MAIQLNMYHAVAVAAVLFWLGGFLTKKIAVLAKLRSTPTRACWT